MCQNKPKVQSKHKYNTTTLFPLMTSELDFTVDLSPNGCLNTLFSHLPEAIDINNDHEYINKARIL